MNEVSKCVELDCSSSENLYVALEDVNIKIWSYCLETFVEQYSLVFREAGYLKVITLCFKSKTLG